MEYRIDLANSCDTLNDMNLIIDFLEKIDKYLKDCI
jgi:hypothetical protein